MCYTMCQVGTLLHARWAGISCILGNNVDGVLVLVQDDVGFFALRAMNIKAYLRTVKACESDIKSVSLAVAVASATSSRMLGSPRAARARASGGDSA